MYSSVSKGIALHVFISFIAFTPISAAQEKLAIADTIEFRVQPQQCVTLRQGRDCFATITMQWQKPIEQSLCLYQVNKKQNDSKRQLRCWKKNLQGQAVIEFESSDNLTYQLRTQQGDHLVAETEIVVSWLHKNTTKRRRWRLF
jgi:hypothetical protein